MKALKIVLTVCAVMVAVVLVGAVIFIKTFDVNRFKPQILAQAKTALGRDVDFGNARLDVGFRGISLKLDNLSIADDPAFQKEAFVTVREVEAAVDALAYLTSKTISVPLVLIKEPKITLIRAKDGTLNVQTITPAMPAAPADAGSGEAGLFIAAAYAQAPAGALPAVSVASFKVVGGTVLYIDRSFDPALAVDVNQLDVTVEKFSLTRDFPFKVNASVFSLKQNIAVLGSAQLDMNAAGVTVSGLKVVSELGDLALDALPKALPMLKDVSLPAELKGKVEVSVPRLVAGAKGLSELQAEVTLSQGSVTLKELATPVKGISLKAQASEKDLTLENLSLFLGSGSVNASAKVQDYLAAQTYSFNAQVKDLKAQEVLNQEKAAVKVQGQLGADIACSGKGFSPDALKTTLSGTVAAAIAKAALKDINVLRAVLDKIDVIPGLSQSIEAGLPQKFKDSLSVKDTSFADMKLPVAIEDGEVVIKDAAIVSEMFSFKGSVRSSLGGRYVMEGDFLIPQELSAAMAASQPKLAYLFNSEKLISFPLRIKGSAVSGPQFIVDSEYIAKRLITEQGTQQLFKAIDKELGEGEDAQALKGAVSNVLGNIFGK